MHLPRNPPADAALPPVSLELLRLFVLVARSGTIAVAARELHMVPSVASRKIAALERAFQTRLFDRTTRRIHLTEAGALALDWARSVVEGHENVSDELAALQGSPSGLIRLVMNEYIGTALLPPFLAAFSLRYPQIRYAITMSDQLVGPDERGYDVAVHSGRVPDSGLMGVHIMDVQRLLCASPAYLARRGVPQVLPDLARHDCIAHQQNAGGAWHFRHGDRMLRQPIHQLLVADSYVALVQFALQGLGVVRVSISGVREALASGALVQVLPEYQSVYPDGGLPALWVLYPNRQPLRRTRLFVDEMSTYLRRQVDETM